MNSGEPRVRNAELSHGNLAASLRRNWRSIAFFTVVITTAVFLLASMAAPIYRAETRVLIEAPAQKTTAERVEGEKVASQLEIVGSPQLLAQVARQLNLASRREFTGQGSLLDRALVMAGLKNSPSGTLEERVLEAFREKLSISQVENSRVIVIRFSSEDPELVARVPNAIADAYVAGQHASERQSGSEARHVQPDSHLVRYEEEAVARPPLDARVFSRATVPSEPYFPKVLPITAAAFAGSLLFLVAVTLLKAPFSRLAPRPAPSRVEPDVAFTSEVAPTRTPRPAPRARAAPLRQAATVVPTARRQSLGEVDIEVAAESLISTGITRAIFISPEGDEAAAAAVLVAREVADAGLRVLLLDLTMSGAASRPMLENRSCRGITDLLSAEAQFSQVIHADLYSGCHIIPSGTADPMRAIRGIERLPIIMKSLTIAYDLVVVECGPADAASIRWLMGEDAQVLVSVLNPGGRRVAAAAAEIKASGYGRPLLVTPMGYVPPTAPPDRDAA